MAVDRRPANESPKNDRTDLEVWLRVKGPELLRRQAANIILGLALLIALGMLLYSRSKNKAIEQAAAGQNAAAAYDFAFQLRSMPAAAPMPGLPAPSPVERQQRARDALNAAEVVLGSDVAKPVQKAIAQLAKADVYWELANLPDGSLAATQPVSNFAVKSAADYLADAEAAYTDVLRNYTDEKEAAASALLGLAAVAENRGVSDPAQFEAARKWYQRVIDDASLRDTYREMARTRQARLADLEKPYVLAGATSQPTTMQAAAAGLSPFISRPPTPASLPTLERTPTTAASSATAPSAGSTAASRPTTAPEATTGPTTAP